MTTTGSEEEWKKKYRRLFSSLNRYAKPVDKDTIIAMDEDDIFCILTRRMVAEYPFFQWEGAALKNEKLQCKGKNISGEGKPYFTSLQTLNGMNTELLRSPENESNGMFASEFTKNRHEDEDQIDAWFDELVGIWDAYLRLSPELHKDPSFMRTNNADEEDAKAEGHENNALFRPIQRYTCKSSSYASKQS